MEDVLVLILLVVMVTIGMGLVFGGLGWLAFDAYRSTRRSQSPAIYQDATGVEAEAFIIRQNQDVQIERIEPIGDKDSLILIIRKSG